MKKALSGSLLVLLLLIGLTMPDSARSASIGGRFVMQDHNGKFVTDSDYKGQLKLITFGYTFCPDVCPTALTTMATAIDALGEAGEGVLPIFITVDPARDTSVRLKDFVDHFHPRLVGLTGSDAMLKRLAASYKVVYKLSKPDGADQESYLVDHTASIFLMGPEGEFLVKFMYGMDPAAMAERIKDFL
jgi:cytochrome oxidase Cu insertion factor (SCO1/SenC/PrrC family)